MALQREWLGAVPNCVGPWKHRQDGRACAAACRHASLDPTKQRRI